MFLGQVRRAVRRYRLLDRGDSVVVAVSGGPDSMALLHGLTLLGREEGWRLHAAHLHHGLRGAEADADLDLVKRRCEETGVPLTVEFLAADRVRGPGMEARARRLRYAFLRRVAGEIGAARMATGHTRDDQAETVLLRLLRGSGPRGLAGIQPRREDGVVRPLILVSRAEVLRFLEGAGLAYREDRSNEDRAFLRNRVRHEVLPLLRRLSPRIGDHLASLADLLGADEAFLDAEAGRIAAPWFLESGMGGDEVRIPDRGSLAKLPEALRSRVLLRLLERAGVPREGISDAIEKITEHLALGSAPGGLDLPGGRRVAWDARGVRAGVPATEAADPFDRPLEVPGCTPLPDGRAIRARIIESSGMGAEGPAPAAASPSAVFDERAVSGPLRVRSRRPGDRLRPRGFGLRRKLQDVLTDARVPRARRDRVPLVVRGEEILWVAGVRASEFGRPSRTTRRCLLLELRAGEAGEGGETLADADSKGGGAR
jgi:tRNA(Ile)-lysidine synthase